jgi:hypothetical protein
MKYIALPVGFFRGSSPFNFSGILYSDHDVRQAKIGIKYSSKNLKRRNHLDDPCIDVKLMLRWISHE